MRSKLSLFGVPIVMIIGYIISLSFEWLFPVLTFGAAGLYIFMFAPIHNKLVRYFFLFVFLINLLSSAALYFQI